VKSELNWAENLVRQAGEVLIEFRGKKLKRKIKEHLNDFATEADERSEELLISSIYKNFPRDNILAEESGWIKNEGLTQRTWIIDPLDGTTNFADGSDDFGVMMALAEGERLLWAVIYNPVLDILMKASVGDGAWINGKRVNLKLGKEGTNIKVQAHDNLKNKLEAQGVEVVPIMSSVSAVFEPLSGITHGRVDNLGKIWDLAPSALILKEAGYKTGDFKGNEYLWNQSQNLLAVPERVHRMMVKILNKD